MKKRARITVFCCLLLLALNSPVSADSWPGDRWETSTPEAEGLDAKAIEQLDAEIRAHKHGYIDSMIIIRNGRVVFEAYYPHDYKTLNADLVTGESGPWLSLIHI